MGREWSISFVLYYMTSPGHWDAAEPSDAIRGLRAYRYDGVEWMLDRHFTDAKGLRRLFAKTRSGGLEVSDIMCWQDLVTRDGRARRKRVARLKEMAACAGELSVPVMNIFTGPMTWNPRFERVRKEISEEQAWRAVVESISEVVAAAERSGVVVTVEPVFGMVVHDYYTVKELLGYFDSKHLGVNVDPSHLALYSNDPAWAVRRLGKMVKHVHVKDAFGKPGVFGETFCFPFLGEGMVDWRQFFSALRSVRYEGFLSLEFENDSYLKNVCGGDWRVAARQLRERLETFFLAEPLAIGEEKKTPSEPPDVPQPTTSKISERVYLIDTLALGERNSVAAYLVKGSKTALVDCGYATSSEAVLRGLAQLNVSPSDVDYVIPTHVHLDHGGAAGQLLEHMPRAKVIAQERGVPHLVDPTRLVQSATTVFGEEIMRMYGMPRPIPADRITSVGEEMSLDLGGVSLTLMHSPGHAPHQISVHMEEEKVLLSADAVGIVYPSVGVLWPTTPPPSLNPSELGRTTDRLAQLGSRMLLAPHFGVRKDVVEVLEQTKVTTNSWVEKVREMKKRGMGLDEISETLRKEVELKSGVGEESFPAYGVISIRVSVMGILHYLEKNP